MSQTCAYPRRACVRGMPACASQVLLIDRFLEAQRTGRSLCHQLIMGQGKTTVIAPLLAIMLADGALSVISVVPQHLVHSARSILREKLGALARLPVNGARSTHAPERDANAPRAPQ